MGLVRSLTLVWPGLPWLWLRGSLGGLVLALAFAVLLDMAIVTTWIWSELVDLSVSIGIWTATIAVWIMATASAASSFPAPISQGPDAAANTLFVKARDAYLARDWLTAETRLRAALALAPTDGEAQLLLATLLRRVGRKAEAKRALEQLSRSDSGAPWQTAIARELVLLDHASRDGEPDSPPHEDLLPMPSGSSAAASAEKAA
ncbi:MAG: tetratricopeptide repeat protein [Planctomycetota bacterium]|jgi:tetratricopeptide (TPR) repeat protein|nr:tetratricopeptide repeat protein [Planctomycetota bacterium]